MTPARHGSIIDAPVGQMEEAIAGRRPECRAGGGRPAHGRPVAGAGCSSRKASSVSGGGTPR